ncbi:MAG: RDD family protein [Terriglobales bacterium]
MTALMNTASDGDLARAPQLCDPAALPDTEAGSAAPVELEPWRNEVAVRLARYRARRKPRAPRYPSLLLPFDSSDVWSKPAANASRSLATTPAADSPLLLREANVPVEDAVAPASHVRASLPELEKAETNLIEFPRSAAIPVSQTSTLADPIFDRPRIVEAPEIVPVPPALGGILIEPALPPPADNRNAAESRIQSASIFRRLLATAVDGLILGAALSAFALIFLRFNPLRGPLPILAGVTASLAISLWFMYQFLFIVYTGSTPGLRAARLKLVKFDGSPAPRSLRRWRVLASFLSGLSAGLGYLWCLLDSDSLCWHDRITRTHLRSAR